MKKQNTDYFKQKARELISDKDVEGLNQEAAKMLIASLGLKFEEFQPQ